MTTDKNKIGLLAKMVYNCQQYKLFSNGDLEWDEEKTLANSKNCVEIAEDFAIGFAEWIPYNAYKESSCWRMYDKKDNEYTIQELINEYKKQVEL